MDVSGVEDRISDLCQLCLIPLCQKADLGAHGFSYGAGADDFRSFAGIGNRDDQIFWREETALYSHQKSVCHSAGCEPHLYQAHIEFAGRKAGTAETEDDDLIGLVNAGYEGIQVFRVYEFAGGGQNTVIIVRNLLQHLSRNFAGS